MKHDPIKITKRLTLLRPVDPEYRISSPFGMRIHPLTKVETMHNGIDFACPVGTPVYAMAGGTVFQCGWQDEHNPKKGLGYRVWQEAEVDSVHVYLWYGHLNQLVGGIGRKLKPGDLVGYSGNTGASSGPHLHVQARIFNTSSFVNMRFVNR